MVAVAEDGVPLVDLLHHLRVQTVLLQRAEEPDFNKYHVNVLSEGWLRGRWCSDLCSLQQVYI